MELYVVIDCSLNRIVTIYSNYRSGIFKGMHKALDVFMAAPARHVVALKTDARFSYRWGQRPEIHITLKFQCFSIAVINLRNVYPLLQKITIAAFQSILKFVAFLLLVERLPKECWRHFGSGLKDDENSKDFYLPLGLIWRDEVKRDRADKLWS